MEYNVKLSKDTININGKNYDIPKEVAEFIIYEISTRDNLIQARDVYERTIDKAIKYIETMYIPQDVISQKQELLDILKVVK